MKLVSQRLHLHDSTYVKYLKQSITEAESRKEIARGRGKEYNMAFNGQALQLYKMNKFQRSAVQIYCTLKILLNRKTTGTGKINLWNFTFLRKGEAERNTWETMHFERMV